MRRVQNGDVQRYIAAMVIGAAALLWYMAKPPADIKPPHVEGGQVTVEVKGRPGPRHLRYCWRLDGDKECRSEKSSDSFAIPPGRHRVTLHVEDTDWGSSAS